MHAVVADIFSASPLDMATGIGRGLLWSTSPHCTNVISPPVLLPVSTQSFHDESERILIVSSLMVIFFSDIGFC